MDHTTRQAALTDLAVAAERLQYEEHRCRTWTAERIAHDESLDIRRGEFEQALAALGYARVASFDEDATELAEAVDVFSPVIGSAA